MATRPHLVSASGAAAPPSVRNKIKTLSELGDIAKTARAQGQTVVHAHGVFDLLHLGHVRHLELARREGDILVVTITADTFVNKGPGRPVFTEQLRAEMLAAVEYVDYVGINYAPSGDVVIAAVKPSVFVKGSDYKNPDEDITGKIVSEREAVEAHGGKLVFTDDITFSSSNLINRYMNVYEPDLQHYLEKMRDDGALNRLVELVDRIKDYKVVVVGDAILDEYTYVTPIGKSAKENIIAALFQENEIFAGGVFATANHIASFCREVEIVTVLGNDGHEKFIRDSLKPNVKLTALRHLDAPTTRKNRMVDPYSLRKMFEVYYMDDKPVGGKLLNDVQDAIRKACAKADVVLANDFGHGMLHGEAIETLVECAPFLAVNAQANAANHGYNVISKYPRADYISIDGVEARLAVHDKYGDMAEIVERELPEAIDCPAIVVTQGKHGCIAWRKGDGLTRVPALTGIIVDTVGAGDAFFAVTAPLVKAGASMADVGFLGNAAGATKVGIVGHRSGVEKVSFLKFLTSLMK